MLVLVDNTSQVAAAELDSLPAAVSDTLAFLPFFKMNPMQLKKEY